VKGAARVIKLDIAVDIAHAMEDIFVAAQESKLKLAAAHVDLLIQSNDLPNAVGWQPTLLLDDKALPVQEYTVPTEVPSLVNVKSVSRSLLLGVTGGGVTIVPDRIIRRTNVLPADKTPEIMSGDSVASWWWD
ncbi:MAG: hypothetical protein GY758_00160, partial [Fuerstiella sp.]|nr:hypothetical protein [Fuerstiella sp.]